LLDENSPEAKEMILLCNKLIEAYKPKSLSRSQFISTFCRANGEKVYEQDFIKLAMKEAKFKEVEAKKLFRLLVDRQKIDHPEIVQEKPAEKVLENTKDK
jgi:hypothetical protein